MFPIKDTHQTRSFPFINYLIIAVNVVIFLVQLSVADPVAFIYQFGFIPDRSLISDPGAVFTSLWLHGGWFHLLANTWFLHIFGNNVEDRVGHLRYLLLYVMAGLVATMTQYSLNSGSLVPIIGASGAISGVTGMYILYFPQARIQALVPSLFGFWHMIKMPSWVFLGYWFVIQVFSGVGSLASIQYNEGGVAFFAHIGGFVFGCLVALLYKGRPREAT
ncbi:hypothetical protein A3F34_01255 [Candidatus Roizmanbacteria bacterium RIFCSPHIGHO2_12_FULL_44_10]|uniref:Peptidase S54 rhomboid domain-containing protein n=1 Tax=Candidatus Roizmanbacteria bacterium RIFCSPHIGHO2_12_FULL_44_10 TaxID=1802054 RepID=A0A1F7I5B4_9BACT|nr:MAG: hypothetical protein A3F34_01255 [Candidatus Roizmanbacteria bacterium RIFCSPHIGHO2_12_FULL_44_10]